MWQTKRPYGPQTRSEHDPATGDRRSGGLVAKRCAVTVVTTTSSPDTCCKYRWLSCDINARLELNRFSSFRPNVILLRTFRRSDCVFFDESFTVAVVSGYTVTQFVEKVVNKLLCIHLLPVCFHLKNISLRDKYVLKKTV